MIEKFTKEEQEIITKEVLSMYGLSTKVTKDDIMEDASKRLLYEFTKQESTMLSEEFEEKKYCSNRVLTNLEKICDIITGNCTTRTKAGTLRLSTDKNFVPLEKKSTYVSIMTDMIDVISNYI